MVPPLYPAFSSNLLRCPCPGHFAEARCVKSGLKVRQTVRDAGRFSQHPGDSLCVAFGVLKGKTVLRNNGPQRPQHRVSLPRRCIDATQSTGVAQTVSKGLTWGFLFSGYVSEGTLRLLAEKNLPEIYQPHFTSSKHFENFLLWTESVSLITAG